MSNGGGFLVELETQSDDVTGSCTLMKLRFPDGSYQQIIVDCGSFIEKEYQKKNEVFHFNPKKLDACVITHAHTDHIGRLPLLVKKGYKGKIYATNVTANIIPISLEDSFRIMCEEYKNGKKNGNGCKLYEEFHISIVNRRLQRVAFNTKVQLTPNIEVAFLENGHLFGASMVYIRCFCYGYDDINILFTGDYKKTNMFFRLSKRLPFRLNKKRVNIVSETTYGGFMRDFEDYVFFDVVSKAIEKKHKILLPAFSLGRTQEVLLKLREMQEDGYIPEDYAIYCDGALIKKYHRLAIKGDLGIEKHKYFWPRNMRYVGDDRVLKIQDERKEIIESDMPAIIVASSGNASYGPSNTYLKGLVSQERATILFTGYCTKGSLGRIVIDANQGEKIEIFDDIIVKKAEILSTPEFSAHADAEELLELVDQFENIGSVVLTHGNDVAKKSFMESLKERLGINPGKINILEPDFVTTVDAWGLVKII